MFATRASEKVVLKACETQRRRKQTRRRAARATLQDAGEREQWRRRWVWEKGLRRRCTTNGRVR
eukprot:4493330-Pleurochrysis_carterae.AAC.1